MASLVERHAEQIAGVLSCYDRIIIQGTLPGLCHAEGMTSYLYGHHIRIFDYARFAEPLRDQIRANAERLAQRAGIQIEFVRTTSVRKESRIQEVLAQRGSHPGLVHILSAMETCPTYRPWHDKKTGRTFLRPDTGKCIHYYFYFIDRELGLCYLRVPTWCPFRLQFYFNGHNLLAAKLRAQNIPYRILDNAFTGIEDFAAAQQLSDSIDLRRLHRALDRFADTCCSVIRAFGITYHWSIMQAEYATDVIFHRQSDLACIYETIARTAIHAVKPDQVATFLGRKLTGNYRDDLGNDFHTRIDGTRIKHHMGPASIKMYDKFGLVLRIETTINDVSFFKHYRQVEQRDGTRSYKLAPLKKTIYSLDTLREILAASNQRYLDFISSIDDREAGMRALNKISQPASDGERRYKGLNLFSREDSRLCEIIVRGDFMIYGLRSRHLLELFTGMSPSQISRMIKRLRVHGILKRVAHTYKYYLTELGRRVVVAGLKLRDLFVIPALAQPSRI